MYIYIYVYIYISRPKLTECRKYAASDFFCIRVDLWCGMDRKYPFLLLECLSFFDITPLNYLRH